MIKVICIDNDNGYYNLTINKIYDALEHDGNSDLYQIQNDEFEMGSYFKTRFIPLAEWRDKQINNLLDD